MSTVQVTQAHALGAATAKEKLAPFEQDIKKYGLSLAWKGTHAELKGTGASGDVKVTDSTVTVTVKLGLIAKAAGVDASKLEASIQKRLKAALAPDAPAAT